MDKLEIREVVPSELPDVLDLFWELARWESLEDKLKLTVEQLHHAIYEARVARVALGWIDGKAVAMTLFYPHFAAFTGKTTLYMEQLVVAESCRGKGYGKKMMQFLAALAIREGYNRLEWPCMVDNDLGQGFYAKLGARKLTDRVGLRLEIDQLEAMCE